MTVLWNKWPIEQKKSHTKNQNTNEKSCWYQKKMVKKQDKLKAKNQILKVRQLTLSIKQPEIQLGIFKNILSDYPTDDKSSQFFND